MTRAFITIAALTATAACSTSRQSTAYDTETGLTHSLRTLRIDSCTIVAVAELDSPTIILTADTSSASAVVKARRIRAAVVRDSHTSASSAETVRLAETEHAEHTRMQSKAEPQSLPRNIAWMLMAASLLVLILSWRGIRPRQ